MKDGSRKGMVEVVMQVTRLVVDVRRLCEETPARQSCSSAAAELAGLG
jgi:hypothetical protein